MFRFLLGTVNRLKNNVFIYFIQGYRFFISPLLGQNCRFYPSCSAYSMCAIQRFGVIYGLYLCVKRIIRCHPWHTGGVDPVPSRKLDAGKRLANNAGNKQRGY